MDDRQVRAEDRGFTFIQGQRPSATFMFDAVGTATSLTVTGVTRGTYYVRIRGRNACGAGSASGELLVIMS
jgi:hypothetical protein